MTMDMGEFSRQLAGCDSFKLRRAVERLREGLFDPFGVKLLTAHEEQLNKVFDKGVQTLQSNKSPHLCVCGSYGQGKSHSLTYIRERALGQGFVTSLINLDPREIPFQDFRQVYRALISQIRLPGSGDTLVQCWKKLAGKQADNIIPDSMPHFFKAVLTAMANKNMVLSKKQRGLKKHATFRPREFPWLLANALQGEGLPVYRLRHALKYRQVEFYKDASLVCKGWQPYFQAVCSLAEMFQNMGFKGWVLLFDEGESIGQRSVNIRRKSYAILDRFFSPIVSSTGLYPIFAFTDDFFMQVQGEDYERFDTRQEDKPYFAKDYGAAWKNLHFHHLHDLSNRDWQSLTAKLTRMHAQAYGWEPAEKEVVARLAEVVDVAVGQEARLKIKTCIGELDILQQEIVLAGSLSENILFHNSRSVNIDELVKTK